MDDPSREQFVATIAKYRIPKTTVATLAGVANCVVSEYVRGRSLTDQNRSKIERVIADLVDSILAMDEVCGLRPDMRDIPSLRIVIEQVKIARQKAELQKDLAELQSQIRGGIAAF